MYCVIYYDTNMRSCYKQESKWYGLLMMCLCVKLTRQEVSWIASIVLVKCRVTTEESNSPEDLFQSDWPFAI